MNDQEILHRIDEVVEAERQVRARLRAGTLSPEDEQAQLRGMETALDQCWDLLRQRRSLAESGQNPDDAKVRPPREVEGYLQ